MVNKAIINHISPMLCTSITPWQRWNGTFCCCMTLFAANTLQCIVSGEENPKIAPSPWDFITLPEEDRSTAIGFPAATETHTVPAVISRHYHVTFLNCNTHSGLTVALLLRPLYRIFRTISRDFSSKNFRVAAYIRLRLMCGRFQKTTHYTMHATACLDQH